MNHATLITGASSGIGLEFAKLFAKNGHNLVLVARNKDKLNTLKNELKNKYDIQIYVYKKDLSQKDSAYDIFNYTSEKELFSALTNIDTESLIIFLEFSIISSINKFIYLQKK